jgi:hypothetical protein
MMLRQIVQSDPEVELTCEARKDSLKVRQRIAETPLDAKVS